MHDAASATPLLAIEGLQAWYGESHILHGVDFEVFPGEVLTLLGRNGAGKTTTLKSIMGIVDSRTGSVRFKNTELIDRTSDQIARVGIALCPEERGIFASLSVEENLMLPPEVQPGGLSRDRIFELFPNLKERLQSQGTKLSGGEQQMLAIGRILRTGARLLLLDEPTEGLAPIIIHQIGKTIRNPQGTRVHHPVGRAEFSVRLHSRRSVLRNGTRPHHRSVRQFRSASQPRETARISWSVNAVPLSARLSKRKRNMRRLFSLVIPVCLLMSGAAHGQVPNGVIKIGILNDMSGLYADISGPGAVVAARMAVEDFGAAQKGLKVEILAGDHQNKPDVGSSIARSWIDVDKVDVIVDVPTSSVALAINEIVREKNKVFLASGPASSDLTGPKCSPNTVHWTYDTWALANGTGKAVVKTGGDTWFFITADYAFGHALQRDTAAVVVANGGRVVGEVRAPLNTSDFSSFLLQAQASRAKIIGLANAGGDTVNSIKQAAEFGIVQGGQNLAGLLMFIQDIHALGLPTAQGLLLTEAFYWDRDEGKPHLRQALRAAIQRQHAVNDLGRGICRRAALPKGSRSSQEYGRRQSYRRQNERDTNRRPPVRKRHDSCRRPPHSRHVPLRGEEAGGVEISLGLLQAARNHSRRRSFSPA